MVGLSRGALGETGAAAGSIGGNVRGANVGVGDVRTIVRLFLSGRVGKKKEKRFSGKIVFLKSKIIVPKGQKKEEIKFTISGKYEQL